MEQLLEKQGDGEAGVNSEERAQGGDTCPGIPSSGHPSPRSSQTSFRFCPSPCPSPNRCQPQPHLQPLLGPAPGAAASAPAFGLPGFWPLPVSPGFPPGPRLPTTGPRTRPQAPPAVLTPAVPRSRLSELT